MKVNKLIILFLLIGFTYLTSCMPSIHNYYRPEAKGGKIIKSLCRGQVGPEDMVEFYIDRVIISIKANEIQDGIKFVIDMKVPRGNNVKILFSEVKVSVPSNGSVFAGFLKPQFFYRQELSWQIGDLLIGETSSIGARRLDRRYFMNATINMPATEKIELTLPEFYINNKQWSFPEISFTKDKWSGIIPINC